MYLVLQASINIMMTHDLNCMHTTLEYAHCTWLLHSVAVTSMHVHSFTVNGNKSVSNSFPIPFLFTLYLDAIACRGW
jgi:hypothetical protein